MLPSFLPPRYHLAFHALIPEVLVKASRGFVRFCVSALIFHFLSSSAIRAQQTAGSASAPSIDPKSYAGMKWRLIGPFRGGRVLAVTGVPSEPNTFYFGGVAGGVWRSTDAGMRWTPLTDKEPFASVGAIAVSELNPNVIYAGTGEGCIRGNATNGDGVYKSVDGGRTWKNVGLRD